LLPAWYYLLYIQFRNWTNRKLLVEITIKIFTFISTLFQEQSFGKYKTIQKSTTNYIAPLIYVVFKIRKSNDCQGRMEQVFQAAE